MTPRGKPFPAKEGTRFRRAVKVSLHEDEASDLDRIAGMLGQTPSECGRAALRDWIKRWTPHLPESE